MLAEDSRDAWGRLRRIDAKNLLKAHNIQFDQSASKDAMVSIAQANGINPYDGIEWDQVQVPMENGGFKIERYPKRKAHATLGKDIDYDAEMEKRTKIIDEQKEENDSLKKQVADLTAMVQKLLADKEPESEYAKMGYFDLKRLAKERGHTVLKTMKKPEIIELLENEQNTP